MTDSLHKRWDLSRFSIETQPNDTTCGPTCLHSVYGYFGDDLPLQTVIDSSQTLDEGGTLAALLGIHALRRGYRAKLYSYNLQVFDPTWFGLDRRDIARRLQSRFDELDDPKLRRATASYLEYLNLGGRLRFEDMTPELLRRPLKKGLPVLTGLSATNLYRESRETPDGEPDDLRGEPVGHFVVLCGYDPADRRVRVADPLHTNPMAKSQMYTVGIDRVITSILLGVLTYDGNCLILEPGPDSPR